MGAALDVVAVLLLRQQQLDADPQQQERADYLEVGQVEQVQGEEQQQDADQDGTGDAAEDRLLAPVRRQVPAGEGDDYGVVAAQRISMATICSRAVQNVGSLNQWIKVVLRNV